MDRIIVTSILIIGAITSAGLVVISVSSNTREDSQITANIQNAMGDQLRTRIQIASATANPQGTLFKIWAVNIGSVDITPIADTDVFLERTDNVWGARIPNGAPGISWSVVPTPPDKVWEVGETLQLNISLPAGADPGYPISERLGTYQVTLVTLNGAHAEHVFDHNPMFRLFAFGSPSEGGIVTGSDVYPPGTDVTVDQTNNAGFTFDDWSEACTGTGPCNVTMDASKAVIANFSRTAFTLTTNALPAAGGAVAGGGTYPIGTVASVTHVANAGFTFDDWSGDCTGTGPCNVIMDADKDVIANFSRKFILTTSALPPAGGAVAGGGTYPIGTVASVTHVANAGFTFDDWSGACTGTGLCNVTMDADKDVIANFSRTGFTLTTRVFPAAGGTVAGGGTYPIGTVVNVTQTSNLGFTFSNWTGACFSRDVCNVTMDADKPVRALFVPD